MGGAGIGGWSRDRWAGQGLVGGVRASERSRVWWAEQGIGGRSPV